MEMESLTAFAITVFLGVFLFSVFELLWLCLRKPKDGEERVLFRHDFWQPLRNFSLVAVMNIALPVLGTAAFALLGASLAPYAFGTDWYVWIIALFIYEFWYWLHHFMSHKVRLLWCIHSPHHAPDTINMVVGYNHHVLEVPYMSFFLGFMPALCGIPVEFIIAINIFDGMWGSMLHASPRIIKKRYGPLEYFMQTPSFHRAHHAQNPRYMDTNYNATTQFWDWVMGTRQVLRDDEPVRFGITRDVNVESWADVQFGEFSALWRDVRNAPGLANKLGYLLQPPGWSHTGDHKMASTQKQALLE